MSDEAGGGESPTTPESVDDDAPTAEIPVVQVPPVPTAEALQELAPDPSGETDPEPVPEPDDEAGAGEAAAEPAPELAVEPAADDPQVPVLEAAADDAQEPVLEPAADDAQEPAVETAAEEAQEPVLEPAAEEAQEPALEPGESRRSWWAVPLGVIGVALVVSAAAVGGVAYGRASAPEPEVIVTAEPVVEESAATEQMPVGVAPIAEPPSSTDTPPTAGALTTLAAPTAAPVLPSAVLTAAPGLPDTATLATGYRLVNAGISGAQVAAVLAPVFGAAGQPVAEEGGWVVGTAGGPILTVNDDPLFTWDFEDAGALAAPAFGEQLDPATAIELTTALLGTIGVDTASVDWQVDRYAGRTAVTAWQLVGGQRTDLAWRVAFDPSGAVVQASGFSAGLEEVPGYPVVGAASAVARSAALPWSLLGAVPALTPDPTATASATPLTPLALPGITVPVSEVTVTEAALGLAQYWQPDGGMLMLPSYLLTGDDGSRWSLLAVDEPYVQFVDQPNPAGDPAAG